MDSARALDKENIIIMIDTIKPIKNHDIPYHQVHKISSMLIYHMIRSSGYPIKRYNGYIGAMLRLEEKENVFECKVKIVNKVSGHSGYFIVTFYEGEWDNGSNEEV